MLDNIRQQLQDKIRLKEANEVIFRMTVETLENDKRQLETQRDGLLTDVSQLRSSLQESLDKIKRAKEFHENLEKSLQESNDRVVDLEFTVSQ